MRVSKVGDGPPEYVIVAGIHGDEPEPVNAIEEFLDDPPDVGTGIKIIIAHERALDLEKRYIEHDLNRSFSDSITGATLEHDLAKRLKSEIGDCKVLDLHTTESVEESFLTLQNLNETKRELARSTGLPRAVDASSLKRDGLIGVVDGITVEIGLQEGSDTEDRALEIIYNFLAANGVIDEEFTYSDPNVYKILEGSDGTISKPKNGDEEYNYEIPDEVRNFELTNKGEPIAFIDGEKKEAERDFVPVIFSAEGYPDIFGFRAKEAGPLSNYSG